MSSRVLRVVRWCLVGPAAIAAWLTVAVVAMAVVPWLEHALCPAPDWVSGFCHNSRVMLAMDVFEHVFVGLSAVVVVLVAAVVAPDHKRAVALQAFVIGTAATLALLIATSLKVLGFAGVAIASGAAALWAVNRWQARVQRWATASAASGP